MSVELTTTLPDGSGDRDESFCSACGQSFSIELDKCPNDGARLIRLANKKDTLIGRVFENRYEVRARLGAGGMGTVYRGWQLSVDREVAIKVIDPRLSSDRVAVKRFLREARLSSRLSQPNIVNVYDFGQTDDGILYIAMELLRGKTLAHELAGRPIAARRAAGFMQQLCDALESAHAQTIVHRDLKPGNIIVLDDPPGRDLIKVLDFGLAKSLTGDALSRVTKTDAVLGTPLYMSPEQIDGKPSDQRADLYAAGCIFYEMLVGRPPFVDQNIHTVLARHMSEPPPALPAGVPPAIDELIMRMLAKRPEMRPQSAGEVRRALQSTIDGGVHTGEGFASLPMTAGVTAGAVGVVGRIAQPVTPPATSVGSFDDVPGGRANRRGRVVAIVLALGVGAGIIAGGVALATRTKDPSSALSAVIDARVGGSASGAGGAGVASGATDAAIAATVSDAGVPAVLIDATTPVVPIDAAVQQAHPPPHSHPPPPPHHTIIDAGVVTPPPPPHPDPPDLDFIRDR